MPLPNYSGICLGLAFRFGSDEFIPFPVYVDYLDGWIILKKFAEFCYIVTSMEMCPSFS